MTRLPAADAALWTFAGGAWQVGSETVAPAQVGARFPSSLGSVTVVMPPEQPSDAASVVLIAGLEQGIDSFELGHNLGAGRWTVLPPPPRSASHSFAVISVRPEGVTVAATGGAELAVPCGACSESADWVFDDVSKALAEAAVDDVLVVYSQTVPWGAVLRAVDLAADRRVRIARGD